MANIESKNLLVAVKAYSRGNALPLDASEIYDSLAEAQAYAKEANAYAGQTIKVLENGEYKSYVLQPGSDGLTLKPVGSVQPEDLKDFVQVVSTLPTTGEENVIYLVGTDVKNDEGAVVDTKWAGSIWVANGESGKYEEIFKDSKDIEKSIEDAISALTPKFEAIEKDVKDNADNIAKNAEDIEGINEDIKDINDALDTKAPIENPVFVGTVKVKADSTVSDADAEEVAVKSYVDGLIAGIHSNTPKVVNSENPLPTTKYKAGNIWRVSEAGTYAGQKCEIGDVIICLNDYKSGEASDNDFLVVQANIDGAVTSTEDAVVDTEIVVFDGVTGKVVKSSKVTLSSLNTVIADSHTHENKAKLDTYDKTQSELLAAAATDAQTQISTFETNKLQPVIEEVNKKANAADVYTKTKADELLATKADSTSVYTKTEADELLADKADSTSVYTKTEIDGKVQTLEGNINTKLATSDFNEKIGTIPNDSEGNAQNLVSYIDKAVEGASDTVTEYVDDSISEALGEIKDAEGNAQTVKDYVDAGLNKKADKATTLAGYGITDAYTKGEVDSKVSGDIASAKSELQTAIDGKVAQGDFDTLEGKVDVLIGTETDEDGNLVDANKSVRTIANEEIAAKLIAADAKESLDTLAEIAAWIQKHPEDAASMNEAISALQKQLQGIDAGEGTVKTYIDNKVANIDLTPYAKTTYVDTQDEATLNAAKAYTDAALTIVRF